MAEKASLDNKLSLAEKISAFLAFHVLFIPPILFLLTILFAPSVIITRALLLYITFVVWSGCGIRTQLVYGNPWRRFSEDFPIFHILRSYLRLSFGPLPKELIDAEKIEGAKFIFAAFPHGCSSEFRILMEGVMQHVLPNVHHKLRSLAATILFRIPIVREIALWTGCVDANRKTAERNLDKGNSLLVLPGGEAEQLMTEYGKEKIYLLKRKGFIKMAMRKRVPVVPVYVFGSSDLFYTSRFLYGPRYWLMKNLGICIPICRGMFGSPMCPLPKKVTVILGSPLNFEMQGSSPTEQELDIAHAKFMKELKLLFNMHKASYGYGDREIEII
mmetsp:Transcript_20529/g.44554  ORF Transcript_20529/g.44554 Transcript_20529/m.44554 type:complete len:330 (-) Transcript_20529:2691-3680(-)